MSKYGSQAACHTVVIIYLRPKPLSGIASVCYPNLPYRSLGLPLEGFTAFHRGRFQSRIVTVALSGILGHGKAVVCSSAVTKMVPRLIVSASTNTTGIAARASMDLPNATSAALNYPKPARLLIKANVNRRHFHHYSAGHQRPAARASTAALKCPC